MRKNSSPKPYTICISDHTRNLVRHRSQLKNKNYNSIASLNEAEIRIKQLEKRHEWRREKRLKRLQNTYDENCRLYLSINSQKSVVGLLRLKADPLGLLNRNKGPKSRRYDNCSKLQKIQRFDQSQKIDRKQHDSYRLQVRQILKDASNNENIQSIQRKCQTLNVQRYRQSKSQKAPYLTLQSKKRDIKTTHDNNLQL